MKKIKEYVFENKWFILVMMIGFILLLIQMNQVVLYADDFSLGILTKSEEVSNIFKYFINHYNTWGGGYTGCLVILIFGLGINFWKVTNTFLIFLMILLGTRMITHDSKKNKGIVATVLWICIFALGIYTSKECIYWLDGSVAYVLSTFEMFVFIYIIYSKLIMKTKIRIYDYFLLPILGLFAGWSSAQTGVMSLFIALIIILWVRFKQKEKIKLIVWISIVLCLIGCLIFYLSPGNSGRMQEFEEYSSLNIVQKILYRVDGVYGLMFDFRTYQASGMPLYTILALGLIAIVGIQFTGSEQNKKVRELISISCVGIFLFLIFLLVIGLNVPSSEKIQEKIFAFTNLYTAYNNGTLYITTVFPYLIISIVLLLSLVITIYISKKEKNPLLFITLLAAYFTQGIMVMAPYSPLRTTFTSIMFLTIVIGYLCYFAIMKKFNLSIAFIIPLTIYNPYFGIIGLILHIGIKELNINKLKEEKNVIGVLLTFAIIASINWYQIYAGYKINKKVYYENISRIENFIQQYPTQEEQQDKELVLLLPIDDRYGFTAMTGIDWIDEAIKGYFGINNSVKLIGEKKE